MQGKVGEAMQGKVEEAMQGKVEEAMQRKAGWGGGQLRGRREERKIERR